MRLGQLFSNFKNKVKDYGLRVGNTLSHIAKPVLKYGSFIAGGLSHLPGFIGTAAGVAYKGLNAANRLINSLPDSSFKNKLQDLSNKAASTVSTAQPKITARTARFAPSSSTILFAILAASPPFSINFAKTAPKRKIGK